jgi:hypothetical protein
MLLGAFQNCPGCSDARVMWDHATGRSRGFGFVSFRHREEAEAAIAVGGGLDWDWLTGNVFLMQGNVGACVWMACMHADAGCPVSPSPAGPKSSRTSIDAQPIN